jgi:hypothetical protein
MDASYWSLDCTHILEMALRSPIQRCKDAPSWVEIM